ncbi:unnamed protein product [Symbiodinium natans]|uniref:Uncharacterized protein n=1 Tax=Symbiodinium natans TaxID=878477 RepID=A0A812NQF1_9DINO|nr:unnamed protein product [Symbiodinium natans]
MDERRVLVRVKRRLDEEPLPEILVEEPRKTADKRQRPDATAAALKLVDTVGSRQWPDEEYGLPVSWFHAAANAAWPNMPPGASLHRLEPMLELREASRRLVGGCLADGSTSVQLIDVDRFESDPSQDCAMPASTSGFTVNGMELIATPCEQSQSQDDFVWDVYALGEPVQHVPAAAVQLQDPVLSLEETDLDELESMDSSDEGGADAWSRRSNSDDGDEPEDRSEWVNTLD